MILRPLAAAFAAVTLVASLAHAQTALPRPTGQDQAVLQAACSADFVQLCAGVDPASSAVEACFQRNRAKLSPTCSQAIQSYQSRAKAN